MPQHVIDARAPIRAAAARGSPDAGLLSWSPDWDGADGDGATIGNRNELAERGEDGGGK
jgi:hypothetical protein